MKSSRPMFLNLFKMKFPITAIVSILHRISGFVLFLALPFLLWLLDQSLASPQSFASLEDWFSENTFVKLVFWLILSGFMYHLIAGIRHLMMDWGWFEELGPARKTSAAVFVLFGISAILLGVWIW